MYAGEFEGFAAFAERTTVYCVAYHLTDSNSEHTLNGAMDECIKWQNELTQMQMNPQMNVQTQTNVA